MASAEPVRESACTPDGQTLSATIDFSITPEKGRLNLKDMRKILHESFQRLALTTKPDSIGREMKGFGVTEDYMVLHNYFNQFLGRAKKSAPVYNDFTIDSASVVVTPGCTLKPK